MSGNYKDTKATVIRQQPGTKKQPSSRGQSGDKINRGSSAGFVPPSVYIGFHLFVLPGTRPGGFSSIVWKVKASVASWANRPVGVPSCPSAPRLAVPPCAATSRPNRGMSGFWVRQIIVLGYVMLEKNEKTKRGRSIGQQWEWRAAVALVMQRSFTNRRVPPFGKTFVFGL